MMNIIPHKIVKNKTQKEQLFEDGYCIAGNLGLENVEKLKEVYSVFHNFKISEGGMFYSLYSDNIEYREKVHKEIGKILSPVFDNFLVDYKSVLNSFIVKIAGPKSDFTLHQDSTGLDEEKHSPLCWWIPLQDTDLNNGTLCVIPKTHRFYHPYRSISFKSSFSDFENELRKYLCPINLKAGDILMFDNRILHYSHLNNSEKERVVVMSGLFPKEAKILSVYKDESVENSPIEVYEQSEDFLISNKAFFNNCTERPYRGKIIKKIEKPLEAKTIFDFLGWANEMNVKPCNIEQLVNIDFNMQIISEPS